MKRFVMCLFLCVIALCVSSCSSMYALNNAVRYEYRLTRDSQTNSKSQILISNFKSYESYENGSAF